MSSSIVWWDVLRYAAALACLVVAGCAVATVVQPMAWHQRCRILFSAVISFAIIHGQITNLGTLPASGGRTLTLTVGLLGFAVGMVGLVWAQYHHGDDLVEPPARVVDRLSNLPAAVLACDSTSRIITAAGDVEGVLGWSGPALIGRPTSVLMPERYRDAHLRGVARVATTGESLLAGQLLQLEALHRDGRELPVTLVVVPLAGQRFLGVIHSR